MSRLGPFSNQQCGNLFGQGVQGTTLGGRDGGQRLMEMDKVFFPGR